MQRKIKYICHDIRPHIRFKNGSMNESMNECVHSNPSFLSSGNKMFVACIFHSKQKNIVWLGIDGRRYMNMNMAPIIIYYLFVIKTK